MFRKQEQQKFKNIIKIMEGDDEWNEDFSETFQNYGNDNCLNRKRVILHFDIDCFYAQVEMLKDPTLKTKPLGIKQKNIVVTW